MPQREIVDERKPSVVTATSIIEAPRAILDPTPSSWPKAVRILAYVRRFASRKHRANRRPDLIIDAPEFKQAEGALIKLIQSQHFFKELAAECKDLPRSSELAQLNPCVDQEGLIRCKSRLEKSSQLFHGEKFPVILPGKSPLTQLLVRWIHAGPCLHSGGVASMLHELRRNFFVTQARRCARSAVVGCKVYIRFTAQRASEPTPPLPAFRVESCSPFSFVGTDFAGPIYYLSQSGSKRKAYVLLFVCAVTRAARLELVADLTTDEFLIALRRFLARNPCVSNVLLSCSRNKPVLLIT